MIWMSDVDKLICSLAQTLSKQTGNTILCYYIKSQKIHKELNLKATPSPFVATRGLRAVRCFECLRSSRLQMPQSPPPRLVKLIVLLLVIERGIRGEGEISRSPVQHRHLAQFLLASSRTRTVSLSHSSVHHPPPLLLTTS
ncbi:Protein of unknown function [Gryllus bimaculatus]|nr:Protein of unknown function [Gryllus bimaculatus]